ncbi:MAG: OB-fold domain-containing protein [Candidatus Rokubacteria bacterium]|nr:OB-fold domain-containing protein [Candidatus Rokubacteria bacterium]
MAGICAVGSYVPRYRLTGKTLAQAWGAEKGAPSALAVANYDEDSITMAVEAAQDALAAGRIDSAAIDALYFASTTPPFSEKLCSAVVAAACDLREGVATVDFCNSVRGASLALQAAFDGLSAGRFRTVLVVAADARAAEPSSALERTIGAGAGALVLGSEQCVLTPVGHHHEDSSFVDFWRRDGDAEIRSGDAHFIQRKGYVDIMRRVITTVLETNRLTLGDVARVLIPAPDRASLRGLLKVLKCERSEGADLVRQIGYAGTAMAPLLLAAGLSGLRGGDRVLLANYGDGADASVLQATDAIEAHGPEVARRFTEQMTGGVELGAYGRFLRFRGALPRAEYRPWSSLALFWREEKQNIRFCGSRCADCRTVQFPRRQTCITCGGRKLCDHTLGRSGTIYTYTVDHLFLNENPPLAMACVDLDGGGRFYGQMTDCEPEAVAIGQPVRLTFRRLHEGLGHHNYFWKIRPAGADGGAWAAGAAGRGAATEG